MAGIFENFPYTNFHRLNLDWLLSEMNKVVAEWADMQTQFEDLEQAFRDLKQYCEDYFANLDISQEVSDVLDRMLADGDLDPILNPKIASEVTAWLNANCNPVGSAVTVDSSLLIAGSAADSKVVGDRMDMTHQIVTMLFNNDIAERALEFPGSINLSTGRWTSMGTTKHIIFPVNPGDVIDFTARGSNSARYSLLKTYKGSVADAYPDYAAGYALPVEVAAGTSASVTVGSDARWLYFARSYNATRFDPEVLTINGYNAYSGLIQAASRANLAIRRSFGGHPFRKAIDHGGFYGNIPAYQNSPLAFYLSAKHGVVYHNIDIVFASDGVPIVSHSATPVDTNGVTVDIQNLTSAQVKTHMFGNANYNWEPQTLREANETIMELGGTIDMVDITSTNDVTRKAMTGALPDYYRNNNIRPTWTSCDYDEHREAFLASAGTDFGMYLIGNSAATISSAISFMTSHPGYRYCISVAYSNAAVATAFDSVFGSAARLVEAIYVYTYNLSAANVANVPGFANGVVSEDCNAVFEKACLDWTL